MASVSFQTNMISTLALVTCNQISFIQLLHDGRLALEQVAEAAAQPRQRRSKGSEEDDEAKNQEQLAESMKAFVNSTKWMSQDSLKALLLEKVRFIVNSIDEVL